MVLNEGDIAEDFILSAHDGTSVQLASYKNQKNSLATIGKTDQSTYAISYIYGSNDVSRF